MADSASIGASFSNYQGNAGLGEINGSPINIDTRPLQQLAIYTNLYNKNLWEQQQAETNAKINQLAKLSDINVASLHGKDKDEFGSIWVNFLKDASEYARKMPKTPEEKVQQQLDWQVKYGKISGLYNIAKQRSLSYLAKLNTIATSDSDASKQDVQKSQLDKEFDNTDITTPLSAMPQYKMQDITLPKPVVQQLDNLYVGGDQNSTVKSKIFNPALNSPYADATVLGIKQVYPQKGTPEYDNLSDNEKQQADQQATVQSQGKIWSDMVVPLNSILQTKGVNGKLLYYDENGNFNSQKFEDDNAANSVIMQPYNALKALNGYSQDHYNQAKNGAFNDKGLDYTLPSSDNSKLANDFKAGFVDFTKPITPNQLVLAGTYSQFGGDSFDKTLTETGKQTQMDIAKMNRASSERIAAGTQAGENYRKRLDLIGKGWEIDAKGKLKPPTKTSTTAADNGGIVPYWQNYIVPQIQSTKGQMERTTGKTGGIFGFFQKDVKEAIPNDFTGDVDVAPDKISGLSVALLGEKTADGKQKGISGHGEDPTSISVRFDKGNPIGVVIDGVFYDQNDINSKATQLNDKTVSNKTDSPIFDNGDNSQDGQTQQSVPKLTDAQKYLQSLKSK